MMSRWRRSRAVKKFTLNKLAVAALGVIMLYVLVGILGLVGVISVEDAEMRVGPNNIEGFSIHSKPEKRLGHCAFVLEHVENALKREGDGYRDVRLAERALPDLPKDQLQTKLDDAFALYDELADTGELDSRPDLMSKLDGLEVTCGELLPVQGGAAGAMYRFRTLLGTDRQGRSIMLRSLYSVKIALQVGLVVALLAVTFGTLIGSAAAFYGGWVDHLVQWMYSTFSSIPNLVLLALLVYMFTDATIKVFGMSLALDGTLIPVYVALASTFWIGPCRLVRGEVLKIKELEYVQAARAIGFSRFYILIRHVIPNTAHLMLINFSLLFIAAVKSEVILTFLGLGVKKGASWGLMISHSAQEVVGGFYWQIGAATFFMFFLVLAFNIVADALQDAFDPKHVG